MYIYNVTINIDGSVHDEWLHWLQNTHVPDMLATQKFLGARIVKVLVEEEMGGTTYSIQYFTQNKEMLQRYYDEDADRLRQESQRKFGGKFVAFRTELELISDHQ